MNTATYPMGVDPYLPFMHIIWSDDLLSSSEIEVVRKAIRSDISLTDEARDLLLSWLDPHRPPSPETQKNWRNRIRTSEVRYREDETFPLSAFSKKVSAFYNPEWEVSSDLPKLEKYLGIQPIHYRHLYEQSLAPKAESDRYEASLIASIHLGAQHKTYLDFRPVAGREAFRQPTPVEKEKHRELVSGQLRMLAGEGYGALAYPEAYGGRDDMAAYAAIFENLMFLDGSLCIKYGVQFGLFGGSIQKLGTQPQLDTFLKDAGTMELPGCFAMTETMHGSNVKGLRTTATYRSDSGEIVIHTPGPDDNKEYIGNALEARMATVFAQLIVDGVPRGVHAILVPIRDASGALKPGVRVEDNGYKLGLNGVDNGKIWFEEVGVPVENLLGRYGGIGPDGAYHSPIPNPNKRFFTMLGTLVGGRICVGKGALAGAKLALAIAVKYALKRRQFNDSVRIQEDLIMDYPSHQLRLMPKVASCYVFQAALDEQLQDYLQATGADSQQVEARVAGLKALITEFANTSIQECREACGGKGYLKENRIGDLKSDVDIFTTFEGDNTVLLQLAAKGRLTDFRTEFNSDDFFGVLRLLGTQLARRLSAINPAYVNKTDRDHLYNPSFHQHAFAYRTGRLTYTLALRIRDYIKNGMPSYQAFLKVQTHLVTLGKAYSEEIAYAGFRRQVEKIAPGSYQELFDRLGTLHALSCIASDASWYMQQGYIGKNKSKAIKRRVERLCSELRAHAEPLVDGFAIPDAVIDKVPIAR